MKNYEILPNLQELTLIKQKIKQLEEQLTKIQTENNNLKLENKHLKVLIKQDQAAEAKVVQLLTFK